MQTIPVIHSSALRLALGWLGILSMTPSSFAAERAAGPMLKVASVQMRSSRSLADNGARIAKSIQTAAESGARVVIFPECALTSYRDDVVTEVSEVELRAAEDRLGRVCRENGIYAIVGSAWREDGKLYDSALVLGSRGEVITRYHKIQLAEGWPAAGQQMVVFSIDEIPCSIILCHDERYPELVRLPVLAGARLVFYLSHESGLREEQKIGPYRAQIQARAVENTVFVVQANAPANSDATGSHGQSRIIAPDGVIVQEASMFGEDVVLETIDLSRATRGNALKSLTRGPLQDWWRDGIRRVKVIP